MVRAVVVACLAVVAAVGVTIASHGHPPRGLVVILSGPGGQATCAAAFDPDGTLLAVAACNDSVSLWNVATRRWIATMASPRCPDSAQVLFSPDGTTLVLFSGRGPTTCLWHLGARRETTLIDPGPRPQGPDLGTQGAISPGGTTLAVADSNGNVYLWDLATNRVTTTVPAFRDCGPVCPVAFSPDGTILAVGDSDGSPDRVFLWDLTARRWTATLTDPSGGPVSGNGVNSLAFSKNGILAVGDVDGRAYGAFPQDVTAAFSPDGTVLAINVNFGYGTYLYDFTTGKRSRP
jgi:WD40 repeat protein